MATAAPGVQTVTVDANRFVGYAGNTVTTLNESYFTLGERVEVLMKNELKSVCALVLFHVNNEESDRFLKVFAAASASAVGKEFYLVNLSNNRKLAKALTRLQTNNTSESWMGLLQSPVIIVYQKGHPVGTYNGSRTVQSIVDFAMTLACSPSFSERIQVFRSVRSDVNFGLAGLGEAAVPTTSLEFNDALNLRPVSEGAAQAVQAAQAAGGTTATL